MKAKAKIKSKKNNLTLPGTQLSAIELAAHIEKAEKGPFYPIEELEAHLLKWKEKYAR